MSAFRWIDYFALTVLTGRFDLTGNAERLFKRRIQKQRIFWPGQRCKRVRIPKYFIARDLAGTWR